jgi:hypothetical protein
MVEFGEVSGMHEKQAGTAELRLVLLEGVLQILHCA